MKRLFNDGWSFTRQELHTDLQTIIRRRDEFQEVGLPHDWLIYDGKNLYQDGTGWYRKQFTCTKNPEHLMFLRFDGIYMDSKVFINRKLACEWKYGYSMFEVDMTPYLNEGENEILVSVDFQAPNSRWYSGAGIYRNVWIKEVDRRHIVSDGIYVYTEAIDAERWKIRIQTELSAEAKTTEIKSAETKSAETKSAEIKSAEAKAIEAPDCELSFELYDLQTSDTVELQKLHREGDAWVAEVHAPKLWSPETPNRYQLRTNLVFEGQILQTEDTIIGFRTLTFDPDQGFLLNQKKCKLNGVCEHHDLGCLGTAYHPDAMRRKIRILKEMGVNAIRLTHNMHAENVLELADEMGMLLVSEAFDMWESSKTTYDYARFFPKWYKKDVASWIRRDRNHPSVIMWSIGNEIYDTHASERGQMWTRVLEKEVQKHDPLGHARVTLGSNYMPWENAQKCADIIKVAGYNYGESYYDDHHKKHPDWIIYGSETASIVQSRGIYHFPYQQTVLADEDEQCSALGNSTTSWGAKSTEACILAERDHVYSCGQFLWTGFDYIGEPTPYHTRNSYFGQVDTAGFPKDSYYIYQAEWTDYKKRPMVHIFPYWDFNEGQLIDVRVCSNAPMVELYFNGKSQGTYTIEHAHGTDLVGHWQLPYADGEICAIACDEQGQEVARETRYSFGEAAKIKLTPDVTQVTADGSSLVFMEISMQDEKGHPVENANNRVQIRIEGSGTLVGLDNGDSTDTDEYKGTSRRLFSGKLLAVLKSSVNEGTLQVTVTSEGLPDATLEIPVLSGRPEEGSSPQAYLLDERKIVEQKLDIPVRNIKLTSSQGILLNPENPATIVTAQICPTRASDQELIWSIVDDAGIPMKLAEIEPEGNTVKVTAKSDGQFRLRCMSKSGTDKIRIISQLEFQIEGLGKAFTDPYEFVSAGLYDYSVGEVGNGNEHGVATARFGETQVGFHQIDFGTYGSDEICLPIFALDSSEYQMQIYEGMPGEDGTTLLADVVYQKPSIWNVYQEETYHLNRRLTGITSICFVLHKKVHIKGFTFTRQTRAWEQMTAASCDSIYGDSFVKEAEWIRGIGNNVTIEFSHLDFGVNGTHQVTICGSTPLEKNTIMMRVLDEGGTEESRQVLEYAAGEETMHFSFAPVCGMKTISFVFLPGCDFDFHWVRFEKKLLTISSEEK